MDRIADFLAGDVDLDLAGDRIHVADQFQLVTDHVKNAALLETGARFFVDEDHGHVDFDLGALRETQEVRMFGTVGDRVKRDILGKGAQGLAADFDAHDRVHEVAGAELADQFLLFDVNHHGIFLAAVDHGGNTTFAAQLTGGSLASPFARFGRQGQSVAHGSCLSSMR